MAKLRDVVDKIEIRAAKRATKCRRNGSHKIARGDLRVIVTPSGPAARDYGYCADCGAAILEAAQQRIAAHLGKLQSASTLTPIQEVQAEPAEEEEELPEAGSPRTKPEPHTQ